jgi:hypothetical protein
MPSAATYFLISSNGNYFEIELPESSNASLHTGDVVTFTYESISKLGYPVGANLQRVRKDLTWKHLDDSSVSFTGIKQVFTVLTVKKD